MTNHLLPIVDIENASTGELSRRRDILDPPTELQHRFTRDDAEELFAIEAELERRMNGEG